MTTIMMNKGQWVPIPQLFFWFAPILLLLWWLSPTLIHFLDLLAGLIDSGIRLLILLALIYWFLLLVLAVWLGKTLYTKLSLLLGRANAEPFNTLTLWQQHILYLALYALLVFSATGCLMTIC